MTLYYRPVPRFDAALPVGARPLAGGWCWFDTVEVLRRASPPRLVSAGEVPEDVLTRLTAPRPPICGIAFDAPALMGILNVTPDSFSDGGQHFEPELALSHARAMTRAGARIIDIGGESTRPGAALVPVPDEIARTAPVISALHGEMEEPISIDTRKAEVARAGRSAGAAMVNDVSGLTFDAALAPFCAEAGLPVCVMHAQGTPETMQNDPRYDDVALDVYDFLARRIDALEAAGIPRRHIMVDPGIGFGKTLAHNLTLLRQLSLFHGLGCPILLGASRKRFIGTLSGVETAQERVHGSVAVALSGIAQGVQMLRVHDVAAHAQAIALWQAATQGP